MKPQHFNSDGEPIATHSLAGDDARFWLSILLRVLAIVGVVAFCLMLWRVAMTPFPTLAPISPMQIANDYSVTPVSSTSSVTQEPMRVIVMTPANTPTPHPVLWQTATAEARLTATATWKPQPCPTTKEALTQLPPGTLCRQPTATPVPAITSTAILGCDPDHWLPGELCQIGAPFAPTPTPDTSTPIAIVGDVNGS